MVLCCSSKSSAVASLSVTCVIYEKEGDVTT